MTDEEIEKTLRRNADNIGGGFDSKVLDYINRLKAEKAQIRKDTAKEILQEVYKLCGNLVADNSPDSIDFMDFARAELLTDLCQKYGVEVDDE